MQDDDQRSLLQKVPLFDVHRNGQNLFDRSSVIATRPETVRPADHQKADPDIAYGVLQRSQLSRHERVHGNVHKDNAVVRHQCESAVGKSVSVALFDDSSVASDRFGQRLPFPRVASRSRNNQDAAGAFDKEKVLCSVVLSKVVFAVRDFDRRLVLVVAGMVDTNRQRELIQPRSQRDVTLRQDAAVFAKDECACRLAKGRHQHGRFVVLFEFDLLRQLKTLDPDFVFVLIIDRQYVDGNAACPQLVESFCDVTFGRGSIRNQDNPAVAFRWDHRGR